ncbi:MAG: D-amino-acid transaminase [Parcubacteria group bacterium LiPW_41]|nr:MAG: D-amino-acid transaminase [Parcubacteria group bacterium LiPW_41]
MKQIHFLNGKLVSEDGLLISPRDLGFTRSFGVFDYLRTYNSKPFMLERHLQRLLKSAELINLKHRYDLPQLISIVKTTLEKNTWSGEKAIKIILSGGVSDSLKQTSSTSLIVTIDTLKMKDEEIYKTGVKANLINFVRHIPQAKTTNYIEAIRQNQSSIRDDAFELFYCTDGWVHEGMTSNIFIIKGKKIYTPKDNVLFGVTRSIFLEELRDKFDVSEKNIDVNFLLDADEVFITSSGKEVVPVVVVNNKKIGNGNVGETTARAMQQFHEFTNWYCVTHD